MTWVRVSEWVWMSVSTVSHACHAKATSNAHCPLGSAHCPTPATQKCTLSHTCHTKEAETQGRQPNPRAYIRPLGSAHCPVPATQKRRRPRDASRTRGHTSDPLAVHIVPRLPRKRGGDPGTPAEPQAVHPTPWQCALSHATPWQCTLSHGCHPDTGDARAYIRPLAEWASERASERAREWVSEWVSVWVCECVSVMSECVWDEWVSDEGGGREEGADTELKTKKHLSMWGKTKHVFLHPLGTPVARPPTRPLCRSPQGRPPQRHAQQGWGPGWVAIMRPSSRHLGSIDAVCSICKHLYIWLFIDRKIHIDYLSI